MEYLAEVGDSLGQHTDRNGYTIKITIVHS
jgi:hypothetical protein